MELVVEGWWTINVDRIQQIRLLASWLNSLGRLDMKEVVTD